MKMLGTVFVDGFWEFWEVLIVKTFSHRPWDGEEEIVYC